MGLYSHASQERLSRVFRDNFSVEDIAEPLCSFDHTTSVESVLEFMRVRDYRVVGVRHEGELIGFIERDDLPAPSLQEACQEFTPGMVLPSSAGYERVITILNHSRRAFIEVFGKVGGIVTRTDMSKPPVRMWLFGMITIIEMGLLRMIEENLEPEQWQALLQPTRLEKALELQGMRVAKSQQLDLLDCLQFCDKCHIIAKSENLRSRFNFASRKRAEDVFSDMESLRDSLAHSDDIVGQDWDSIVQLAGSIEELMAIVS